MGGCSLMAEVNCASEKCWQIKEVRPIPVVLEVSEKKSYTSYRLVVAPMVMRYSTYEHLDMGHAHHKIGVRYGSYDYSNGACEFFADSMNDVNLWLEKYKGYVKEKA
jgi:hypothetical protein